MDRGRQDRSETGVFDYSGEDPGLVNQGWKDSKDSIFHADGRLAQGPIAVIEVQGYVCPAMEALANWRQRTVTGSALQGGHAGPEHAGRGRGTFLDAGDAVSTPLPVTATAHRVVFALPTRGICSFLASHAPNARRRELTALSKPFCRGWGVRTLPLARPATTRCRITTARYGRTTLPFARPESRAMAVARMPWKILADVFEAANQFSMRIPELYCSFRAMAPRPCSLSCRLSTAGVGKRLDVPAPAGHAGYPD